MIFEKTNYQHNTDSLTQHNFWHHTETKYREDEPIVKIEEYDSP